jgi:hypothetical protein
MNKNNTKTVSLLSEAIVAVMADEPTKATHLVAAALRSLTSEASSATTMPKTLTKKAAPKTRAKRRTRPALNPEQVANFAARVQAGDTIAALGRNFGISYPTAHRYYQRALEAATSPQQ